MAKLQTNFTTYLHSSCNFWGRFCCPLRTNFPRNWALSFWDFITIRFLKRYHLNHYKIIFISKLFLKLCSFLRQFLRLMRPFCSCGSYCQDELRKAVKSLKQPYIAQITNETFEWKKSQCTLQCYFLSNNQSPIIKCRQGSKRQLCLDSGLIAQLPQAKVKNNGKRKKKIEQGGSRTTTK